MNETDDAEIAARYRAGATTRQLAARFGCDEASIRRSLNRTSTERRMGRGARRPADSSDIVNLRAQHRTWKEIAEEVGLSPTGCRKRWLAATGRSHD